MIEAETVSETFDYSVLTRIIVREGLSVFRVYLMASVAKIIESFDRLIMNHALQSYGKKKWSGRNRNKNNSEAEIYFNYMTE